MTTNPPTTDLLTAAPLAKLINTEIMPRYMELFDATGLGSSVLPGVVEQALADAATITAHSEAIWRVLSLCIKRHDFQPGLDCLDIEWPLRDAIDALPPEIQAIARGYVA